MKLDQTGDLGQRLRWARQQQGVTLQQLSERTDRAVSYLCQLEKGVKTNPTKQTVEVLASALGVRPAFLFGEVPGPVPDDNSAIVWNREAAVIGDRFRRHMLSLPPARQEEITFRLIPTQRFTLVARFLLEHFAENFTTIELAYQLGMSLGQFRHITEHEAEASFIFIEQLSRLSGVPISFFTHGTLESAPEPTVQLRGDALQYLEAIRLALAGNLSPERLEAVIRALVNT